MIRRRAKAIYHAYCFLGAGERIAKRWNDGIDVGDTREMNAQ